MNERIKELAEQCRKEVEHFSSDTGFTYTEEFDEKKFAELIVRECANYLDAFNRENHVVEGMDGAYMKQHFGVEE